MERAMVCRDGIAKPVKNLGWLLRNWQKVERFVVEPYQGETPVCDAWLTAICRDGTTYRTPFASKEVLRDWLNRPVFRTLPLNWFGTDTAC